MTLFFIVLGSLAALLGIFTLSLYLAPKWIIQTGILMARKTAGLTHHKAPIGEGLQITFLQGGRGEALLLLHGFGADKDIFSNFAKYLTRRNRLIIPDLPGFGESSSPATINYAPDMQAQRLHRFLQALHIDRIHLAGNSMGGQIAIAYAALFPESVQSLCLIAPSGIWSAPQSNTMQTILQGGPNPLIVSSGSELRQSMALGMKRPPKLPAPLLNVLADQRIQNAPLERIIFQELLNDHGENKLQTIQIPTLLIMGQDDPIILPELNKTLSLIVKNLCSVVIREAAHVPTYERPRECAEVYLDFLRSIYFSLKPTGR